MATQSTEEVAAAPVAAEAAAGDAVEPELRIAPAAAPPIADSAVETAVATDEAMRVAAAQPVDGADKVAVPTTDAAPADEVASVVDGATGEELLTVEDDRAADGEEAEAAAAAAEGAEAGSDTATESKVALQQALDAANSGDADARRAAAAEAAAAVEATDATSAEAAAMDAAVVGDTSVLAGGGEEPLAFPTELRAEEGAAGDDEEEAPAAAAAKEDAEEEAAAAAEEPQWDESARDAAWDVATAAVYMSAACARSAQGWALSAEKALTASRGPALATRERFALSPSPVGFAASPLYLNDSTSSDEDDGGSSSSSEEEAVVEAARGEGSWRGAAPTTLRAPLSPTQRRKKKVLMRIVRIAAQAEEKRERMLAACEPKHRRALRKKFAAERRATQKEIQDMVASFEAQALNVARRREQMEQMLEARRAEQTRVAKRAQRKRDRRRRQLEASGGPGHVRKMMNGKEIALQNEVYHRMGLSVTEEQANREREVALRSGKRQLQPREVIQLEHKRTDLLRQLSGVMREERTIVQRLSRGAPGLAAPPAGASRGGGGGCMDYAMPTVRLPRVVPKFVGQSGGGGRGNVRSRSGSSGARRGAASLPALNFARLNS